MAGISVVADLLKTNPILTSKCLQSCGFFSAKAAASAAAASAAVGAPYVYNSLFSSNFRVPVAYCDAGPALSEDYISNLRSTSLKIFQNDNLNYSTKDYKIELRPLYSAFEWRALTMTTLRSFLMFFLPLLEPRSLEEDDDDFLQDTEEEQPIDYTVPFKKSVKQIAREATVTTTRRILERVAVLHVSQRMAWKLLKDVPKSAMRKAGRRMPTYVFMFSVGRTTFRGHFLGVAASWIIQVAIDIYRTFSHMITSKEEVDEFDTQQQLKLLGKKVSATTTRCGASLIFASIGAAVGATLFRPSIGQWVGCLVGDLAGPVIVSVCLGSFSFSLSEL